MLLLRKAWALWCANPQVEAGLWFRAWYWYYIPVLIMPVITFTIHEVNGHD